MATVFQAALIKQESDVPRAIWPHCWIAAYNISKLESVTAERPTMPLAPAADFTLPGTSLKLNRMGYGAMQLAGPHVFGPPRDIEGAGG